MSIPERQPTIASTKDLALPIDFLPGEDDVKLREGKKRLKCNVEFIIYFD
jgi:hypothetical protein